MMVVADDIQVNVVRLDLDGTFQIQHFSGALDLPQTIGIGLWNEIIKSFQKNEWMKFE
jgi:hypothetical protein